MARVLCRIAALLVVCFAAPAKAADWAVPSDTLVAAYNWTGFYVGVSAGGAHGTSRWTSYDPTNPFATGDFGLWGGLVSGTAGYNLQNVGRFVLSEEVDVGWTNLSGSTTNMCVPNCETVSTWLATARLRLGYALDRYLPYVTGGWALSDINARFAGAPLGTDGAMKGGWVLGGGMEFVVAGPVTAKVEYLHVQFGSQDCYTACAGVLGPVTVKLNEDIIRAGLNFRLWAR